MPVEADLARICLSHRLFSMAASEPSNMSCLLSVVLKSKGSRHGMRERCIVRSRCLLILAVLALASCGGGGGGAGDGFLPLLDAHTIGQVALSGVATFDAVPNTFGALDYVSTHAKPIGGAVVEVLSSNRSVLASTTTDAFGVYSVSVPANAEMFVRVKAQMLKTGSGATWDVSVRDNTQSSALYVMDSKVFSSGTVALTNDLHAASGWGDASYVAPRTAGPFALLDTVGIAMQKVLSVAPDAQFPPLQIFWSVNNVPSDGDRALGQIGTTEFVDNGIDPRTIYVLGKEGVDTDEYDSSVVAHEWGHYYHTVFSRNDSPGGSHSVAERLDRRLAFSEGWGNAWSGIALERGTYTDSLGTRQGQGVLLDLTAGPAANPGWYREQSIQSILWNLNQAVGFPPIHAAMTGGMKTSAAMTSIHSFTAAFDAATPGSAAKLAFLLDAQGVSSAPNDPFGSAETNRGGAPIIANALPMYNYAVLGFPSTACVSNTDGGGNKLGSYVYLRVALSTAGIHQILVVGQASADPDFEVHSAGVLAIADKFGSKERAAVDMHAGDNIIVINDSNNSPSACFTVSIE